MAKPLGFDNKSNRSLEGVRRVIYSKHTNVINIYPVVSDVSQMRFAGFNWVGCRLAGVIHNLYYDREDGVYRICVGAGLKFQVFLPLDDFMRSHRNTPDLLIEVNESNFYGDPLYTLESCVCFVLEWIFHIEVTVVSYLVVGYSDRAAFKSLHMIEEFFSRNWNNRLLDSFAVRSRFSPFVDSEFFYVRFFCGTLGTFVLRFCALARLKLFTSVMRMWVARCLLFLEGRILRISKIGRVRSGVSSLRRLHFLGGRRILGSLLGYSRFRDLSAYLVSDAFYLDVILASLRNYYGLRSVGRRELIKKRFFKVSAVGRSRSSFRFRGFGKGVRRSRSVFRLRGFGKGARRSRSAFRLRGFGKGVERVKVRRKAGSKGAGFFRKRKKSVEF